MVRSYSPKAKFLHWAFIGVFAFGVINQVDEVDELENFNLLIAEVVFAIVFLVLLLLRFMYMRSQQSIMPQLQTPKKFRLLASVVHLGMYISLALIAITGLIIGGLYYSDTNSGFALEATLLMHEIVFWTSVNLICLHIVGAIYHRSKGDGVWNAMVPMLRVKRHK